MQVKKVLTYGGIGFVAYYLFARPLTPPTRSRGAFDSMFTAADSWPNS